jgi:hypothetical protein
MNLPGNAFAVDEPEACRQKPVANGRLDPGLCDAPARRRR